MMRATMLPGRLGTILIVAALGYLAVVLAVYLLQEKILYFPDVYPPAEAKNRAKTLGFRI